MSQFKSCDVSSEAHMGPDLPAPEMEEERSENIALNCMYSSYVPSYARSKEETNQLKTDDLR